MPGARERDQRVRVGILGAGRVGSALARALRDAGVELVGVGSRSPDAARRLAAEVASPRLGGEELLRRADLLLLTVGDDALAPLAAELAAAPLGAVEPAPAAVAHCSGALGLQVLGPLAARGHAVGCLHPLQAIATTATPLRPGLTFAVTADGPLRSVLVGLARRLQAHPLVLPDEAKTRYHAAAALAANYTVTLTAHAAALLQDCGLSRTQALTALIPLLYSTIDGLAEAGLPDGLTGPLARGDVGTVARHLAELADRPDVAALYRAAAVATLPLLADRGLSPATVAGLENTLWSAGPSR